MIKISIVIEVKPKFIPHFRENNRRRLLRQISKQLSRGFPTTGIYHSHNTERKGGRLAPHIHLFVSVPDEKLEQYLDQLPSDLIKKDRTGYFQLSDRKCWVLDYNLSLLKYCLGSTRKYQPEIIYGRV